ncbi:MAG: hypothetical protein JKY96_05160 [Phycisphaerales bacterium]|nr:hypothetical protein [Phycisphaerales bacterium]
MRMQTTAMSITLAALTAGAFGADRDIQITSVALDTAVIQLSNLGTGTIGLNGWRFCTHSTTERFRYSSSSGLNGVSIDPSNSLFIYLNNDAPAIANHLNASSLGGTFASFDLMAYAISFYSPGSNGIVSFGDPTDMADHVQFSLNGINDLNADERTDEAVTAGLWTAIDEWVPIQLVSTSIDLNDETGGILHGPSDYDVPPLECAADIAPPFGGVLNLQDVFAYLALFNAQNPTADLAEPFGTLNLQDVFAYLALFNQGCP